MKNVPKKGPFAFEQPSAFDFPPQFPQLDVHNTRVHDKTAIFIQLALFLFLLLQFIYCVNPRSSKSQEEESD